MNSNETKEPDAESLFKSARRLFYIVLPLVFICLFVIFLIIVLLDEGMRASISGKDFKDSVYEAFRGLGKGTVEFSKANISELTAAMAGATTTYLFYNRLFMKDAVKYEQQQFVRLVAGYLNEKAMEGVLSINQRLDTRALGESIANSNETVIVDTWIGEDILADIRQGLHNAFDRQNSTTIYLLHPNSPLVRRRGLDLDSNDPEYGRKAVISSLEGIKAIYDAWLDEKRKRHPGVTPPRPPLHVYCYDLLPALQIYELQDTITVGFYLHGVICSKGYQIVVSARSALGSALSKHVEGYNSLKKLNNISEVDLDKDVFSQFDSNQLQCQLNDAARQLVGLTSINIAAFDAAIRDVVNEKERGGSDESKSKKRELIGSSLVRIKEAITTP